MKYALGLIKFKFLPLQCNTAANELTEPPVALSILYK